MSIRNVGSIFIPVRDLERSVTFYTDKLGLICRGIEDWAEGRRGAALFCDPHPEHAALITLVETAEPFTPLNSPGFNLNCSNAEVIHQELAAKQCLVSQLERWDSPWNHHVLFDVIDPDGHKIGFIEMVPL